MSREPVCTGCGAVLQSDEPNAPGYIPASAQVREQPVCRRCFRIRNYGEFSRVIVPTEEYEKQVSQIAMHPGTVVYVVDVFDIHGSMIPNLSKYIGSSPVIVAVNKVDLLPREVHPENLEKWVRRVLEQAGIRPRSILFVSGQDNRGIDALISAVQESGSDPVYVVGMANVGKSTILNRWLSRYGDVQPFTASRVPGTTLGLVPTQIVDESGKKRTLIDTPGLIHGNRVIDVLCSDCLKAAIPTGTLRPLVFQLNPGQSLWIGGFARFDFVEGDFQPVVCYVSNALTVHRTKLEKADHIYEQHADDILQVPCESCRSALGKLRSVPFAGGRFKGSPSADRRALAVGSSGSDLVLSGLGWISLIGKDISGKLWIPRDVQVTIRPRLIGQLSRYRG